MADDSYLDTPMNNGTNNNGSVLWEGPSLIDGRPIVMIATGLASGSANTKTGAMVQTWILRADVSPQDAVWTGEDHSVCGDCPHRGTTVAGRSKGRTCYVRMDAPSSVYRAYRAGRYPRANGPRDVMEIGRGRSVRVGSYGDAGAVPGWVTRALLEEASGHTGYTHQHETRLDLQPYLMASVDTEAEAAIAQANGWRTFRIGASRLHGEVLCPASEAAGHKSTCDRCGLCRGATPPGRSRAIPSVMIPAHGPGSAYLAETR